MRRRYINMVGQKHLIPPTCLPEATTVLIRNTVKSFGLEKSITVSRTSNGLHLALSSSVSLKKYNRYSKECNISLVEKQQVFITSHLHTQADPLACTADISCARFLLTIKSNVQNSYQCDFFVLGNLIGVHFTINCIYAT